MEQTSWFCGGLLQFFSSCFRTNRQRQNSIRRTSSTFLTGSADNNQLVVVGPAEVGKTSLVNQYLHEAFGRSYTPTIQENHIHLIKTSDGKFHAVNIKDTSGLENFPAMLEHTIRNGRGFILVFALNNAQSFQEAIQLWEHMKTIRGENVPVILVGNKKDLREEREVFETDIKNAIGDNCRSCKYTETSAQEGVSNVFHDLVTLIFELE
ncbi:hypothetical protein TNCT_270181 [Trichonephila clavata]|uniref:Uncharacterized protein n=1 Tax=Trichonephila clavata TaxID=2740835 RepID=A0A8X6LCB2_TRICU|nr:hypothetical protein TNCT_270181 [Trichonephila clavata]